VHIDYGTGYELREYNLEQNLTQPPTPRGNAQHARMLVGEQTGEQIGGQMRGIARGWHR